MCVYIFTAARKEEKISQLYPAPCATTSSMGPRQTLREAAQVHSAGPPETPCTAHGGMRVSVHSRSLLDNKNTSKTKTNHFRPQSINQSPTIN